MEMIVLTSEGDTKYKWDTSIEDEQNQAEIIFNEYKEQGFSIFRLSDGGERGEVLSSFDPDAQTLLFIPKLVGG